MRLRAAQLLPNVPFFRVLRSGIAATLPASMDVNGYAFHAQFFPARPTRLRRNQEQRDRAGVCPGWIMQLTPVAAYRGEPDHVYHHSKSSFLAVLGAIAA